MNLLLSANFKSQVNICQKRAQKVYEIFSFSI